MVIELGRISTNLPEHSPSCSIYRAAAGHGIPTPSYAEASPNWEKSLKCSALCHATDFASPPPSFLERFMTYAPWSFHLPMLTFISGAPFPSSPYLASRDKLPVCSAISNVSRFSVSSPRSTNLSLTTLTWNILECSRKGNGFGAIWIWVQFLAMLLAILHKFLNLLCFFISKLGTMLPLHGAVMRV